MPKTWSGKEVVRILVRKFGFVVVSQKGSHVKLKKRTSEGMRTTVVPLHSELAIGTLRSALALAGIEFDAFKNAV